MAEKANPFFAARGSDEVCSLDDTVVFPAFKKLVTPKEYDRLGDQFEALEHKLFGKEGFDGVVTQIAGIEKALGIYDLSQCTPAPG